MRVGQPADMSRMLERLFLEKPSTRVIADADKLAEAAAGVLPQDQIEALRKLVGGDEFLAARAQAISRVDLLLGKTPDKPRPVAVVSGLSNGGLIAAAMLAKAGYKVEAFELRGGYTRNIQFAARQGLVDQLAAIDPKLADQFLQHTSKIERGSVHIRGDERVHHDMPDPRAADPRLVPQSGVEMLQAPSAMILECKVAEGILMDYLKAQPNVTVRTGARIELGPPNEDGERSVKGLAVTKGQPDKELVDLGTPALVVVSEGGRSATRDALGIETAPTSPMERHVAGVVKTELGGAMSKNYQGDGTVNGTVTGSMNRRGAMQTWIVSKIAPDTLLEPNSVKGLKLDPKSPEYREQQQVMVEEYFRDQAALVMEMPKDQLGAIEGPIEGTRVAAFTIQQRISTKATAGNVLMMGDAVGNGHWSVGGGMQTAAIAHTERLKHLLLDLDMGKDKVAAMERYGAGVLEDTLAWAQTGIPDFYPEIADWRGVQAKFTEAVAAWREGKAASPLEALQRLLEPLRAHNQVEGAA